MLSILCAEGNGTATWPLADKETAKERALTSHKHRIDQKLQAKGLLVDEDSHRRLAVAANRALKQAATLYFRQMQGDWRPDPDADRFPAFEMPTAEGETKADELSFEEAWKEASSGYAKATCKRWRPILESLLESAKQSDVRAIAEEHIEVWKRAGLAAGGVSRRSFARNNLAAVKTFFGKLKDEDLITVNPAVNIKLPVRKRDKGREMRGFRNDEAFKILEATFAPSPVRLSKHYVHARRWVPRLCAYTGARVNEITQARACDVRFLEGYWCILITPEAGTQKTCSKRDVPIHPHLIEQGFLEFVRTKSGDAPLFALRSTPGKTEPSELVGEHLAKWVRSLKISDEDVAPNHGWRHRFKTEARRHLAKDMIDAIQGHAPKTKATNTASTRRERSVPRSPSSPGSYSPRSETQPDCPIAGSPEIVRWQGRFEIARSIVRAQWASAEPPAGSQFFREPLSPYN